MVKEIKVLELFAGVGGFRLGLEGSDEKLFKTEWMNQWEPSRKSQDAFQVYDHHFKDSVNIGKNVSEITEEEFGEMDADMIVGGFPCIMEGELVLTEDGYRPIENILVGDYVYTHTGTLQKVLKTMTRDTTEYYKIKSRGNHGFGVTGEHPIYINKGDDIDWVDMEKVRKGELVGIPKIRNKRKVTHPRDIEWRGIDVKTNSTSTKRVHKITPEVLSDKNFWWMVGYFIGNGWVSEVNTQRKRDGKVTPRFTQKVILSCGKNYGGILEQRLKELDYLKFTKVEEKSTYKFIFSNKELSQFLLQFGKGASNKTLTKNVMNLPKEYLETFIEGYSDSDGHITKTGSRRITTTSKELAYDVSYIIDIIYDKPTSVYKTITPDTTIIEGRIVNQRDYYVIDYFKESNRGIDYTRTENHKWTEITEIEEIKEDIRVYNIEVEEDNSYIVQNVIVHNCQDYSVARTNKNNMGLTGKKGVLFWDIIRATDVIKPKYLLLENVDRLLKSPTKQRGRDFAVMLGAFNQLGYSVEWRVINAAEYGRAQRRRRVFIFVFRNDLPYAKELIQKSGKEEEVDVFKEHIFEEGLYAKQFPIHDEVVKGRHNYGRLDSDVVNVSDTYSLGRMWNAGLMHNGVFHTYETSPIEEEPITLGDIKQDEGLISEERYLDQDKVDRFDYLRGSKKIDRVSADGHKYVYSEGGMSPYDSLDLPGRTMLTSEGLANRSTHLLKIGDKYRMLTPIEAERLQDFPDAWTKYKLEDGEVKEVPDRRRLVFMGNALVVGIVKRIADGIKEINK